MVEIKSGQTVTSDMVRAGQRAARMAEDIARVPWLIHGGDETYERSGVKVFGWQDVHAAMGERVS